MPAKTEEINAGWSAMPNTSADPDINAAGSVLLKETDGEDKVQPDFLELSEVFSLPPAPAQLSTF